MHYSYWISFVILAARVHASAPARYIANRGLGDICVRDADCVSDDGYPLTCIHPGHSMYGYCQFKDCRYYGCGNHGMDLCVADGENRPWKCASYLDTLAPSSTQAESFAQSSPAATLPPAAATTSFQSAQYQVESDTISFPDPATITDTGIYSIQTSPPTPPSSADSAAPSSDSSSGSVAESPLASNPASDSRPVPSASDAAGTSVASFESSIPSSTTLPTSTRTSSSSPTSSNSLSESVTPNQTTVAATGSPTSGASAQIRNGRFWLAAAGILSVVLL